VVGGKGIARTKREGDGTTPVGKFPLRRLFYRSDRVSGIKTALPARPLNRDDAWCDDPKASDYNKFVRRPFAGHTEALWREDHLYDVLIVIGYNDDPVVPGRGSAIFLHVASPGLAITNGCIAIALAPLLEIARRCDTTTIVDVVAA
jgi:L,D-peptidoglycan transpeptidase YkuD (ErfK/YbiS/YcfS/YnhG family)